MTNNQFNLAMMKLDATISALADSLVTAEGVFYTTLPGTPKYDSYDNLDTIVYNLTSIKNVCVSLINELNR